MHAKLIRCAAAVCFGVAAFGLPAATGSADDFKVEDGYTPLFNGKDLTGWRAGAKALPDGATETPNKKWQVIDGAIVIHGGGGGDLYTVRDFNKAFHLKLEFRAAAKADSGVYVRGNQLQVRDYPAVGPYKKVKFVDGGWNELDITCGLPAGVITVNNKALTPADVFELTVRDGKRVGRLNGGDLDVLSFNYTLSASAVCKCNGEVIEKAFKAGAKGGVGLQSETGKFEFRRIRIRELD
jgi:hypothetical protein